MLGTWEGRWWFSVGEQAFLCFGTPNGPVAFPSPVRVQHQHAAHIGASSATKALLRAGCLQAWLQQAGGLSTPPLEKTPRFQS